MNMGQPTSLNERMNGSGISDCLLNASIAKKNYGQWMNIVQPTPNDWMA